MFIGEMGCWVVIFGFYLHKRWLDRKRNLAGYEPVDSTEPDPSEVLAPVVKALDPSNQIGAKLSGSKVFLLALPACCDITGTTLMNVGLLFVAASVFQMTRGALVLFVGMFSVIFLHRKLVFYHWAALAIVVFGVAIVGLASALERGPHKAEVVENSDFSTTTEMNPTIRTIIGVLLIAGAQVFTATQFVLEEFILEKYSLEPLKVVGWEGVFGFIVTMTGMIFLHILVGSTPAGRGGYFDINEGWREVTEDPVIRSTSIWIMVCIGCFNFFGISVTRSISATSRSLIDTSRTLFIWMVSLGLGWESFKFLQFVGFALLVYGTFLFNGFIEEPLRSCWLSGKKRSPESADHDSEAAPHFSDGVIEHI